jgi:hypothetical protein
MTSNHWSFKRENTKLLIKIFKLIYLSYEYRYKIKSFESVKTPNQDLFESVFHSFTSVFPQLRPTAIQFKRENRE